MRISRLRLQHFRTYDDLALEFGPGINVLFGKNGQGKTNVIEAIYLATCARSHRHASDQDMIQFGEDYYDVRLDFLPQLPNMPLLKPTPPPTPSLSSPLII